MARRIYKTGSLVEARNTKYKKGSGIIVSGPHKPVHEWETVEQFVVWWFDSPSITYQVRPHKQRVTKNQIRVTSAAPI